MMMEVFSVPQWLIFKKRLLLRKRELCETQNRKMEMRQKIMIQDTLRVSSKQKIQPLEKPTLVLTGWLPNSHLFLPNLAPFSGDFFAQFWDPRDGPKKG